MASQLFHSLIVDRRPTAIGVAAQGLKQLFGVAGNRLAIGQRPSVQPFGHDLDAPTDAQILDADLAQGEIEVAEHGVEECLRQGVAIGFPAQAVDRERGMKGKRIEASVKGVGNAAGLEQLRRTGPLRRPGIEGGSKGIFWLAAAEHRQRPPWLARLTCRACRDIFRSALLSDEIKNQSMRRAVPLALALLTVAACENSTAIRGFSPSPGSVDKLEVNTQSREDVQRLIGSPSAVATFNPNVWYYISEKQESWGPKRPWISEQNVIQITFNDSGRISSLKYYDLEDAKEITMVARITPTSGKELTVLEQLLGNVGKFTGPAKQTGGNPGAPTGGGG